MKAGSIPARRAFFDPLVARGVEPVGRYVDFTPGQIADIVRLYERGVAATRLADLFECSPQRIYRVLRRQGVTIRNQAQAAVTREGDGADDTRCYLPTPAEIEEAKRELLEKDVQQKRESDSVHSPDYHPRVYRFNERQGYTPGSI